MLHDVVLMVQIRSEIERLIGPLRAWGKVDPHGVFGDRKRYGWRQETVTAELRSRGAMYPNELVSTTGTRLS